MVKARITIFFLFLFLMGQTELHQLMKLPILVEHFREHRRLDAGITLLDFLKEHYQGHTVMDNDYQRDMQLPFKTTDCVTTISIVCDEPVAYEVDRVMAEVKKEFNLHPEYFPSRQALDNIFQPPRFA